MPGRPPGARRMQLRLGFNEVNGWWHISRGPHSGLIRSRLRLMDTAVMRIFAFDQPVPDPITAWGEFRAYVQGVLDAGALPMVTFAKFPPPYGDAHAIRAFSARCTELVWSCIEEWGGEVVSDWHWCVWNEPNNLIIGGDLTFEEYRRIYVAVAEGLLPLLGPHLGGRKARIGGPAIDGTHRGYWMDWIARLISEVDDALVGFVSWHLYGDWRPAVPSASLGLEMWGAPDAPPLAVFEQLLMAQTPAYEARARGVARLLAGRDILNVCGELNAISHHEHYYTLGLNRSAFGAAYYVSALIHLLRGGADLEMRWTGCGHKDAYAIVDLDGAPTPAALAKQLFAQHVRFGDMVHFPAHRLQMPHLDAVIAEGADGRRNAVLVNTSAAQVNIDVAAWGAGLGTDSVVLRIDTSTGDRVSREPFHGTVQLAGYGVAVVATDAGDVVID